MSPFIRSQAVTRGDRFVALSVFMVLLAAFTATFSGLPDNPDAEVEFQTTSALARNHTFALGGTPEAEAIVGYNFNIRAGGPGREDQHFSWFGVGQALMGLPFYYAGAGLSRLLPEYEKRHRETTAYGFPRSEYFEHLLVGWRNPLLSALTAAMVVLASRHMGTKRRYSWIVGLTYGLCTFAWPQARSNLSGVQATCFLFGAFLMLLQAAESIDRYQRPRVVSLLCFGTALGMAFLTRVILAPAVCVLVVSLIAVLFSGWKRTHRTGLPLREVALAIAPLLVFAGYFLWINNARFGNPLQTGYGAAKAYFIGHVGQGLFYLLAAPGAGLLWMAPGVLLCPLWFRRKFERGSKRTLTMLAALFIAIAIPIAMLPGWHGAHTYGPRYLLPLLPFLWLGVGPALESLNEQPKMRFVAKLVLLLGLFTSLPGVLVDYATHNDLALQAVRLAYPDIEGIEREEDRQEAWFVRTKLDWRFAAPWAHWRILRHRIAGLGEDYPVREIFFLDRDEIIQPVYEREKGFLHLAWVDFHKRLGGSVQAAIALCVLLLASGLVLALRGLDPDMA